jgi:hypothetical protein
MKELFIDNSFLDLLQTCPRQAYYNRVIKRIPVAVSPGLNFGTAGHQVLDYRYKTCGSEKPSPEVETKQAAILMDFYSKTYFPEGDYRTLNHAIEVFVHQYNLRWQAEPFSVLQDADGNPMVEISFAVPWFVYREGKILPLGEEGITVIYCGRIDLAVLWKNRVVIIDHKTTSVLGNSFWDDQRISPQQLGYCWGFAKTTGRVPFEFVINAIRTKELPLRQSPTWWAESFHRDGDFVTEDKLHEWEGNTTSLIEEFFWHRERNHFPMKKKWCCGKYGRCGYYDVCNLLPLEQREEMLRSTNFQDNLWTPLKSNNKTQPV